MISCAAPSLGVALAVGPTMLIPLMIFGGLLLQNSTIPVLYSHHFYCPCNLSTRMKYLLKSHNCSRQGCPDRGFNDKRHDAESF